MRKLTTAQRQIKGQATNAVFYNPFALDAAERYREMLQADLPPGPQRQRLMSDRVTHLLDEAMGPGGKVKDFGVEDQETLLILSLYEAYTYLVPGLDAVIDQGGRGDVSDWMPAFARTGLSAEEAASFVAVFYQFRRAFRFLGERLVGRAECIREMRARVWATLFSNDIRWYVRRLWSCMDDCPVMLTGETGTGKSRVAKIIGESGFIPFDMEPGKPRGSFAYPFSEAMVPIVIPEYPEGLIEAGLFGHRKGAYTGAVSDADGVFARCREHGVAFLDEVGDIAGPVQAKLLRVLQDRSYTPVGGGQERRFSGRVISATHRDLSQLRVEEKFRDDLYYRLCSDELQVPSLRQRLAQDPAERRRLVGRLLAQWTGEEDRHMAEEVEAAFSAHVPAGYAWPGNVRELEQAVRRVCIHGSYHPLEKTEGDEGGVALLRKGEHLSARSLLGRYCRHLFEETGSLTGVARVAGLDPRTAKRYVEEGE